MERIEELLNTNRNPNEKKKCNLGIQPFVRPIVHVQHIPPEIA